MIFGWLWLNTNNHRRKRLDATDPAAQRRPRGSTRPNVLSHDAHRAGHCEDHGVEILFSSVGDWFDGSFQDVYPIESNPIR